MQFGGVGQLTGPASPFNSSIDIGSNDVLTFHKKGGQVDERSHYKMATRVRAALMRRCPYLPALILLAVALNQIYLARTEHLSAWKGGGFGMFSTTDGGPNRHLHIFFIADNKYEEVLAPRSLMDLATKRAMTFPTDANLCSFARKMVQSFPNEVADVTAVHLEVWRTEFDSKTLRPKADILKEFILKLSDEIS